MSLGLAVGPRRRECNEVRTVTFDVIADRVGLGPGKGADRVDEAPSRAQEICRRGHDRDLKAGQSGELAPARPPQELGAPSRGAEARARSVDHDPIEWTPDRRSPRILGEHGGADPEPTGCPDHKPRSARA